MYTPINQSFFDTPGLELARNLLGQFIVHETTTGLLVARIVETEAYQGPEDRAAHSFGNRKTKRTEIMFGKPGHMYVYQMHTHTLINVVAGPSGTPHAILIRAVEPVLGHKQMQKNRRGIINEAEWTNGPGKLTKALAITKEYYGHNWTKKPLYIAEGPEVKEVVATPRVGVAGSGEAANYFWRFYEEGNRFVSKYRK